VQLGQHGVDRVHRVTGTAAGVRVRLAVIPDRPDGQPRAQVVGVVADRGERAVISVRAGGHRDRLRRAVTGPSEDRKQPTAPNASKQVNPQASGSFRGGAQVSAVAGSQLGDLYLRA